MAVSNSKDWVIAESIIQGLRLDNQENLMRVSGRLHRRRNRTRRENMYRVVVLEPDGVKHRLRYARIVCWLTHGAPPSDHHVVDHINRIKDDDRSENLRWASPSENACNVSEDVKAAATERLKAARTSKKRRKHVAVILSPEKAKTIRYQNHIGLLTGAELAGRYDVSQSTISNVLNGRSWKAT
ncbi:MAG: HNH endonuclease [Calditrichaeota bacterium]|nr:HNH endonuclease [Calditrichota bacterium]